MKRNELYRLIQQTERDFERRKSTRAVYTIIFYTAVLLLIFYAQDQLHLSNFIGLIGDVIACAFLSGIAYLVNGVIFYQLVTKSESEKIYLESLKKKLDDMEE